MLISNETSMLSVYKPLEYFSQLLFAIGIFLGEEESVFLSLVDLLYSKRNSHIYTIWKYGQLKMDLNKKKERKLGG